MVTPRLNPNGYPMRIIPGLVFITILLTTSLAQATPPRIISADETLLANNGTHVFILRKIEDNPGHHTTLQSELVLISRDLITGDDERQWPVLNILQSGMFGEDFAEFTNLDGATRINPFDVLLWRKASNLFPGPQPWNLENVERLETGIIIRDYDDNVTHQLDWSTANAQITASLKMTRATIPPYQAEQGDELFIIPVDFGADCVLNGVHYFFPMDDIPAPRVAAQMICTQDDRPLSAYVVIPPVEK